MQDHEKLKQQIRGFYRLLIVVCTIVIIGSIGTLYLITNPDLPAFEEENPEQEMVEIPKEDSDDFDKIENGIHVRTGFVEAPGMRETINNCTNCHSSKLVLQNRMNAERWHATIRWMQETQNLWDLGKNEEIIVNYLVTNYPPQEKGRRAALMNIDWYELDSKAP